MKTPTEIQFKMNITDAVSKLNQLGLTAQKAVDAVNDFNRALEKCKRMDLEISIKHISNTKKWWQIWK